MTDTKKVPEHLTAEEIEWWEWTVKPKTVNFRIIVFGQIIALLQTISDLRGGLKGVLGIPVVMQVVGGNHVGGCDCPVCKARKLLDQTG